MDDEINLKEYLDIIIKGWKIIAVTAVLFAAGAYFITMTMKPVYESSAVILIRGGSGSGGLSAIASMAGINIGGGDLGQFGELIKTKTVKKSVEQNISVLADLMQSKTLTRQAFNKVFGEEKLADAGSFSTKEGLGKMDAKVSGSFMIITVEHSNPYLAAAAANAYTEALSDYWNRLNYTEARKKKEYLEEQIPIAEASLNDVEEKLKELTFIAGSGDSGLSSQQTVDMTRLKSEFEIQNSVYSMLRREYEVTKLELAKEISPFSDLEKAEVPDSPSGPNKKLNTIIGGAIGLFAGIFFVFAQRSFFNH